MRALFFTSREKKQYCATSGNGRSFIIRPKLMPMRGNYDGLLFMMTTLNQFKKKTAKLDEQHVITYPLFAKVEVDDAHLK